MFVLNIDYDQTICSFLIPVVNQDLSMPDLGISRISHSLRPHMIRGFKIYFCINYIVLKPLKLMRI